MQHTKSFTENVKYALQYAKKGKPVFPCNRQKKPLTENGFKNATTDRDQIEKWWSEWPTALIGMPTGAVSGLWVLDIDPPDGENSLESLIEREGSWPLPDTLESKTGRGGKHIFYKMNGFPIKSCYRETDYLKKLGLGGTRRECVGNK